MSLPSNKNSPDQRKFQIKLGNRPNIRYIFYLTCGISLFINYYILRISIQNLFDVSPSMNISLVNLKRRSNISLISTGPGVPLVIVGPYHLPSIELKLSRHHPLKERPYGSKENDFDYPIGAQLWSNVTEYIVPTDRLRYRRKDRGVKYFHEMKGHYHMDARFGKLSFATINNAERSTILRQLFSAWSNFVDGHDIPCWISHGTLLGWWWGGSLLPWDSDIDIQMNSNFLYVLARFNNTLLSNRYLIDVNPNFRARHPQTENVIDARLIDQQTGYFLDITGVANTQNHNPSSQTLVLSDKYIHRSAYTDLHPLVRTEFEGIPTWRPYRAEACLIKEYGIRALRNTAYQGYNYDSIRATWIGNGPLRKQFQHILYKGGRFGRVKPN